MKGKTVQVSLRSLVLLAVVLGMCTALLGTNSPAVQAEVQDGGNASAPSGPGCPDGQCFADVPASNTFFDNANALYIDGIISGYACGGPGEPCDADNRPYYRPGNNVSRQQMTKFVDLGRRNIADAVGSSLLLGGPLTVVGSTTITGATVMSSTEINTLVASTSSGGEAISGFCTSSGPCYGIEGNATEDGNWGGVFGSGGYGGVYANQNDEDGVGLEVHAQGAGAYAGTFASELYRGLYVEGDPDYYGIFVNAGSTTGLGGYVNGSWTVTGTCCGSTGIIAQNVGSTPIATGDVVTLVGSAPAVFGDNPVLLVKKASAKYDTGVAGIIDGGMHVPDAATRAAWLEQERNNQAVRQARSDAMTEAAGRGEKIDINKMEGPSSLISDAEGTVYRDSSVTTIAPDGYAMIVTTGSFQSLKVDASFGAIKTGDLLTTSTNPGYAMKVTNKADAVGAIIGKAMGDWSEGTGTIPVLVTLK